MIELYSDYSSRSDSQSDSLHNVPQFSILDPFIIQYLLIESFFFYSQILTFLITMKITNLK